MFEVFKTTVYQVVENSLQKKNARTMWGDSFTPEESWTDKTIKEISNTRWQMVRVTEPAVYWKIH